MIALAAAAVGVAAIDADGSTSQAAPLRVEFVHTPDTTKLLAPLIERFNRLGVEVEGRSARIVARAETSGDAERGIEDRTLKPVIWGPASSLWSRLLRARVPEDWVASENRSIVESPQVIAMTARTAEALRWPSRPLGWEDIPRLVASRELRFAHPNPTTSTSGLSALLGEYYGVTGKLASLTSEDVEQARREVRAIEASIVDHAPTARELLERLARRPAGYRWAAVVQETSLIEFNRKLDEGNPRRLVAVYPEGGTFMADYPYIVLAAPWVSAAERTAASAFWTWLREQVTPDRAAESAYRVPDEDALPPVDREHGADPDKPDLAFHPEALPRADVLKRILSSWTADR